MKTSKNTKFSLALSACAAVVALLAAPNPAAAQVYRCSTADGKFTLGDRPCPEGVPGKALQGLPGVPVPSSSKSAVGGKDEPIIVSRQGAECDRLRKRLRGYDDRNSASVRYTTDRYQQECLGYKSADRSKEAKLAREFADQGCDIRRNALREGQQRLNTMNDNDRRAHYAMSAEVARDC